MYLYLGGDFINYPKHRYTGEHPWTNKDWLYKEYITKDKSTKEISTEYGCKANTIQCWLAKFGIKKELVHHHRRITKQYQTYEYLHEEYEIKQRSMRSIAIENDVSGDTIKRWLIKYSIPTNRFDEHILSDEQDAQIAALYVNDKLSPLNLAKMYECSIRAIKTALIRKGVSIRSHRESQYALLGKTIDDIDQRIYDKDWLYTMHIVERKSVKEIAKMTGVQPITIYKQAHLFGIQTRNNSQSKVGLMVGEKHPNWKGGISPLNILLREYVQCNLNPIVAKRDAYTCQMCGATRACLNIHHKIPFSQIVQQIISEHPDLSVLDNKQELYGIVVADCRFNDIDNLITYCKECHIKIHNKHIKSISSQVNY